MGLFSRRSSDRSPAPSTSLEARAGVRLALERGDFPTALAFEQFRRRIDPHSRVVADPMFIPKPAELHFDDLGIELPPDRLEELRVDSLMLQLSWDLDRDQHVVLATLGGALRSWPRFEAERAVFQRVRRAPLMWGGPEPGSLLLAGEPFPPLFAAAGVPFAVLGPDARRVLACAGGLFGRQVVHPDAAAEAAWLSPARARVGTEELRRVGVAATPSLAERLSQPRMDQLREITKPAGVRAAKKADLIEKMVVAIPASELLAWLASVDPRWADPEAVVLGRGGDAASEWWRGLSYLVAHSLTFTAAARRDKGSDFLLADDCRLCANEVPGVQRAHRPPFHLGCRCNAVMSEAEIWGPR